MSRLLFITHPEVVIDPAVPVPDWPLSARGIARMTAFAASPVLAGVTALWSSAERKARDGAAILGAALGLAPQVDAGLHENDRSATGFLPPAEFWPIVELFFANPTESIRGWERAADAQARVLAALARVDAASPPGDVAVVAHGAVGALTQAHARGAAISRAFDQPGSGGGAWFALTRGTLADPTDWALIDG